MTVLYAYSSFCIHLDIPLIHIASSPTGPYPQDLAQRWCKKTINIPRLFSGRLYDKQMGGVDIILHFKAFVAHAFINTDSVQTQRRKT